MTTFLLHTQFIIKVNSEEAMPLEPSKAEYLGLPLRELIHIY